MPCRPSRFGQGPHHVSVFLGRRGRVLLHVRPFFVPIFHYRFRYHRIRNSRQASRWISSRPNAVVALSSGMERRGYRDSGSGSSFFSDTDYQSSFVSFDVDNDETIVHTSSFASTTNTSFSSSSSTLHPTHTPRTAGIRSQVDKLLTGNNVMPRGILGLASGFAKSPKEVKRKQPFLTSQPQPSSDGTPRTAALRLQVDRALNNNNSTTGTGNAREASTSTNRPPPVAVENTTTPRLLGLKGVIDKLLGLTPKASSTIDTNAIASAGRSAIRRLSSRKSATANHENKTTKSKLAGSAAVNDTDNNGNTESKSEAAGSSASAAVNNNNARSKAVNENKGKAKVGGSDGDVYAGNSAAVKVNIGGYTATKREEKSPAASEDEWLDALTDGLSRVKITEKNVEKDICETAESVGAPVKQKLVPKKTADKVEKTVDDLTEAISRVKISEPSSGMPVWMRTMKPKQLWHDSVAVRLFEELDTLVFSKKLRYHVKVEWNALFRTTAGTCELIRKRKGGKVYRLANIKLSQKVLDEPHRLYTTLAHEMCHAAAWILDDTFKPPHGKVFKKYTKLFTNYDSSLNITTCHSYDIRYKYNYQCTHCHTIFGRHSQKIDVTKKNCSCGGDLVLLKPKKDN